MGRSTLTEGGTGVTSCREGELKKMGREGGGSNNQNKKKKEREKHRKKIKKERMGAVGLYVFVANFSSIEQRNQVARQKRIRTAATKQNCKN